MDENPLYLVIAFYKFVTLENPLEEVKNHKDFFKDRDITSRIYISEQGINGQMSASKEDGAAYMDMMHARPEFSDVQFKLHYWHEQVFPRQSVKYRKQLVAIDREADMARTGTHLSPAEWNAMLDEEKNRILIDTRNDYEWKIGHFEGAELPQCSTFRDFNDYADRLEKSTDKKTPVMMYCTGGIRCEVYSALLKEKGFEKVYQLEGGIINYGLQEGTKKWKGKLFVFDDRLSIPIGDEKTESVGVCSQCESSTENYYNCANMDCNQLFLSCKPCLEKLHGCCRSACCEAPRVRPYCEQNPHKPFRKYYKYFGTKNQPVKETSID